jgi:hypothetical protein
MARRYPTDVIAKELGRGLHATIMKAHLLGISLRLKPKRGSGVADIRRQPEDSNATDFDDEQGHPKSAEYSR